LKIEKILQKKIYNNRHNKISAGVYLGMKREFTKWPSRAHEIELPTLMVISDQDPVVSSTAALKYFDLLGSNNKSLKIFDGAKHEIFNDTVRTEAFKNVSEFINQFRS
jgi:alpha-beta hydrolase superfamily lysophospholipase